MGVADSNGQCVRHVVGLRRFFKFRIRVVISIICCFTARPYPTTDCFTCKGVYSKNGIPFCLAARRITPLAWATSIAVF